MIMINKIYWLIKKNILIEKNYKFVFMTSIISLSISLIIFFFINKYFKYEIEKNLIDLNINYFSYVFLSFLVFNYSSGNSTINQRINFEISCGTFEFIIQDEKVIKPYIISMIIYNFIIASIEALIYFTIVKFFDLVEFSKVDLISVLIVLIISNIIFSSIAIIASSFTIFFKKGDVILFLFATIESIAGGVYFPVEILPKPFNYISQIIPLTYSIKAVSKIFYQNKRIYELNELKILLLFAIVFIPISWWIFKKSIYLSKKYGNLSQY